ncbi:MAG: DoxX family protein [Propioniciclava sp.]
MEIIYWILAGLLGFAFIAAGGMKLARSRQQLVDSGMAWAGAWPAWSVKAIAGLEVLGGLGLLLPPLTGIAPVLAPLAAVGLGLTMIGAIITHLSRGEKQAVPANVALLALAIAVAWIGFVVWA